MVNFFNAEAYAAYDEMICRLAEDGLLLTPVAKPRLIERLEFRPDLPRGQKKLASMGWHCITVWECELKPAKKQIRQYQWQQKIVLFRSVLMLHDG